MDPFITPMVVFAIVLGWLICKHIDLRVEQRRAATPSALDQLKRREVEACKHPEEDLVEIRSDAFKKGELVATLCTKCDKQLGPEVWQAFMDRKFKAWVLETQTREERDAEREAKLAELRAEQADLEMLTDAALQEFLRDAGVTLSKMRWGVSDSQDRKRREIIENCAKWRKELDRRGVKKVPSWKRQLEEELPPKKSDFVAGEHYLPVSPKFSNFTEEFDRIRIEVQRLEASATRHEWEVETLKRRALGGKAWGAGAPVRTIATVPHEEALSFEEMVQQGWARAAPPVQKSNGWVGQDFFLRDDHDITMQVNFPSMKLYNEWRFLDENARIEVKPAPKVSWDW